VIFEPEDSKGGQLEPDHREFSNQGFQPHWFRWKSLLTIS